MLNNWLIVLVGGGLGSMLRHGVNVASAALVGVGYPYGTFLINVLGSLLMGVVVETAALKGGMPGELRLFLTTGILGGFTTFSTFALETALLSTRGEVLAATVYAAASVGVGLGALFAGMSLVRWMV